MVPKESSETLHPLLPKSLYLMNIFFLINEKTRQIPFQGNDNWKTGAMFEDKVFSICIIVLSKCDRFQKLTHLFCT
jgi:hypothetical protein